MVKFSDWLAENAAFKPKFKEGDEVILKNEYLYTPETVKVPRTRTGGTMTDGQRVDTKEVYRMIKDQKTFTIERIADPTEFAKSSVFRKDVVVYFLKSDDKTYLAEEWSLMLKSEGQEKIERNKLIFHYCADLLGTEVSDYFTIIGKEDDSAAIKCWTIYSYSKGSGNGSHVCTYFNEEAAKKVMKFLQEQENYSSNFTEYKINVDRSGHMTVKNALLHIKALEPDFTEKDLEKIRGHKLGKDMGLA